MPNQKSKSHTDVYAERLRHFIDRVPQRNLFHEQVRSQSIDSLRILVFYGVGGAGKSLLLQRFRSELRQQYDALPHLYLSFEGLVGRTEVPLTFLKWAVDDLRKTLPEHAIFPKFHLGLKVAAMRFEGEDPDFVKVSLGGEILETFLRILIPWYGSLEPIARRRILNLLPSGDELQVVKEDLQNIEAHEFQTKLLNLFVRDLDDMLPERRDSVCRGVFLIDAYERLWSDNNERMGGARLHDAWLRNISAELRNIGVLSVIGGHHQVRWTVNQEDEADWTQILQQHRLDGLPPEEAQNFLYHVCRLGNDAPSTPTDLQAAIIRGCDGHPLFLYLCAQIVINIRKTENREPIAADFPKFPTEELARKLTERFFNSLQHADIFEPWLKELSLTPKFDENFAIELDAFRRYNNGRSGWNALCAYSFIEPESDGKFYRLHKTLRCAAAVDLKKNSDPDDLRALHQWMEDYWENRGEKTLAFYHRWLQQPVATQDSWTENYEKLIVQLRITETREELLLWNDTALDEHDRCMVGDVIWASAHARLGKGKWVIPQPRRRDILLSAVQNYEAALRTYEALRAQDNNGLYAERCASMKYYLGVIYWELPGGNRIENLEYAIDLCKAAENVRTEFAYPVEWAATQHQLGNIYAALPVRARLRALRTAAKYYRAALRVRNKTVLPELWAISKRALGEVYANYPIGASRWSLRLAIGCFKKVLPFFEGKPHLRRHWASTKIYLANAYIALKVGDVQAHLAEAISICDEAMTVFKEADFPQHWALAQNTLGMAYARLAGDGDKLVNLRKAKSCHESALRIYKEGEFPQHWATTHHYPGDVYAEKCKYDAGASRSAAFEHYDNALSVHTEMKFPQDWAAIRRSMGDIFLFSDSENQPEFLDEAIRCYEDALRVYEGNADDFPGELAATLAALHVAQGKKLTV